MVGVKTFLDRHLSRPNTIQKNGRTTDNKLRLLYVIGTYPLLTTTFIDWEIRLLRQWDVDLNIVSIRRPGQALSSTQSEVQRGVTYLLPFSFGLLVQSHVWFMLTKPRAYAKR